MFIKNENLKVGQKVFSTVDLVTCAGKFTKGHEFSILEVTSRGYDLIDKDGNKVLETGWVSVKPITN